MKNGKMLGAAILAAALLLCLAGAALAAPGDATLFPQAEGQPNISIASLAGEGDLFYILTYDGVLYRYQTGTEQPELLAEDIAYDMGYTSAKDYEDQTGKSAGEVVSFLFLKDGQLYALNTITGQFSTMAVSGGAISLNPIVTMNLESLVVSEGNYSYLPQVEDSLFTGNELYLLTVDYSSNDGWGKQTLVSFNLTDGQPKTYATQFIRNITAYRDGKLLVTIYDQSTAYDEATGKWKNPELHIFDPAADTSEMVAQLDSQDASGLQYSEENDTLYYFSNGTVIMMPVLANPQLAAYLPSQWLSSGMNTALLDGNLYVCCAEGVYVKNTDPAYLPTSKLTVYGGYSNSATMAFISKYPDVALNFSQEYYEGAEALGQAMVSGENSLDVIIVDLSYNNFTSLMRKGYCQDLSGDSAITQAMDKMYPFIGEALSMDGKLYAVPLSMHANSGTFSYIPEALEAVGLTEQDLPRSLIELCGFITLWNDEYADEFDEYQPLQWSDYRLPMFYQMMRQYAAYYQYLGQDLTFDTPLFRSLLTALDGMDSSNLDLGENATPEEDEEIWNKTSLFETGMGIELYENEYYKPWSMTLSSDTEDVIGVNMQVAFVNPRSQNLDMAMRLLECYLENLDKQARILMCPDQNDPVENPYFEQNVKSWEEEEARLEKQLETCQPEEKKDLETNLEYIRELIAKKDDYRYDINAEAIANYRENIAPKLFVEAENLLNTSDSGAQELQSLQSRYLDHLISADQFIKEADNKVRMMILERR